MKQTAFRVSASVYGLLALAGLAATLLHSLALAAKADVLPATDGRESTTAKETVLVEAPRPDRAAATLAASADNPLADFALEVDGRRRTAKLFVPAETENVRRLVLMLHGAYGDADRIRRFTGYGLERLAASEGWLVAYPEGIGGTWNDCRRTPRYPARAAGADDSAFLAELIGALRKRYGIATADVLVAGFSNGGQMALRFAAEHPEALGAMAVIAAQLPTRAESRCTASLPAISSLWFIGSDDPFLPAAGGASTGPGGDSLGDVQSIDDTTRAFVGRWRSAHGPAIELLPERDGDAATSVELAEWHDGGNLLLRRYLLKGSGHVVPQPNVRLPAVVGTPAGDVDFADVVADFLSRSSALATRSGGDGNGMGGGEGGI